MRRGARGLGQLGTVGRQGGRPLVLCVVAAFRVHEHGDATAPGLLITRWHNGAESVPF